VDLESDVSVTRGRTIAEAEEMILEAVRDHNGSYTPGEVVRIVRKRSDIREDVARAALWFLLDRRSIVLTPNWRVAAVPKPAS